MIHEFFDLYSQVEGEYGKYSALWKAVILQALLDLRSNMLRPDTELHRKKAIQWMDMNNQNFLDVCDRADISPIVVYRCKERILRNLKCKMQSLKLLF
jgi:hypothetical protein